MNHQNDKKILSSVFSINPNMLNAIGKKHVGFEVVNITELNFGSYPLPRHELSIIVKNNSNSFYSVFYSLSGENRKTYIRKMKKVDANTWSYSETEDFFKKELIFLINLNNNFYVPNNSSILLGCWIQDYRIQATDHKMKNTEVFIHIETPQGKIYKLLLEENKEYLVEDLIEVEPRRKK